MGKRKFEEGSHSDDSDLIEKIELPKKPLPKAAKKNGKTRVICRRNSFVYS
jgi:hypothetical protein